MIAGFFILIYTFVLSAASGAACITLLSKLSGSDKTHPHSSVLILLGFSLDAIFLQLFHLFHAIDIYAHLFLLAFVISVLVIYKALFTEIITKIKQDFFGSFYLGTLTVALLIAALINGIGRSGIGDIGDYHLQAIQWDEKFPVVRGLGNLRRQLGNNSNWFLLHAFFGCSFLSLKSVYMLNAFLLIISGVYFFPKQDDKYPVLKSTILIYILLMSFRKYVGAVTNDYAITIFTLIIFTEWVSIENKSWKNIFSLLALILVLPTYKLSAIALLSIVIILLIVYRKEQNIKHFLFCLFVLWLIIYLPWFYTNSLQSGYLVYPLDMFDWFDVDWKMRVETLHFERIINIANERVPGEPIDQVVQLPFQVWVIKWIKHLDFFSMFLMGLASFFSIVFVAIILFKKTLFDKIRQQIRNERSYVLFIAIAVALPIWFFNAPATRFIFAYLVFFIAWSMQIMTSFVWNRFNRVQSYQLIFTCILLLFLNGRIYVNTYLPKSKFSEQILVPKPYRVSAMHKMDLRIGFVLVPNEGEQCWDSEIPCTSELDSSLQWRSGDLRDGFSVKN